MICALALVADMLFLGGGFLDSLLPGLNSLLNILIIPLLPIFVVSAILDRRGAGETSPPPRTRQTRRRPSGVRSASGQAVPQRTQTRIKRGRQARKLETIVVEGDEKPTTPTRPVQTQPTTEQTRPQPTRTQPTPQPESSPATQATTEKPVLDVEQQLAAIEQEMAKLEEEMGEPGTEFPSSPSPTEPAAAPETEIPSSPLPTESVDPGQTEPTTDMESLFPSFDLPQEDKSSELKALDELLARLEQRRKTGSISESTYERLKTRYLKRKAEISSS